MSRSDREYYQANRERALTYAKSPERQDAGRNYRRRLRSRTEAEMPASPAGQICAGCDRYLAIDRYTRDKGALSGFERRCKDCIREKQLKVKYGICANEWDEMFEAQGKRCALCGATSPGAIEGWHTDHCHTTGRVRSILCRNCNWAVGGVENGWVMPSLATVLEYVGSTQ